MKLEEFDYPLPVSLIAQYPSPVRGQSRLMVLHRDGGRIEHRSFADLPDYLKPRDLLVTNNTRVLPARLIGRKETGGRCELLLIPSGSGVQAAWEALIKGAGKMKTGTRIHFEDDFFGVVETIKEGKVKIRFPEGADIADRLQRIGHIPLPPYIKREDEPLDRDRYQTVFAETEGSIASPTAGLHFTDDLLRTIQSQGVKRVSITLHVGVGTFLPVRTEQIEDHRMESEWAEISPESQREIEWNKEGRGRVIAVGTTTTRVLESSVDSAGRIKSGSGLTSLFIRPPYSFRVLDGLITNFHLPRSTLVMLVSAFAGKDFLMKAYREAVEKEYRFYSYGDAMLIL